MNHIDSGIYAVALMLAMLLMLELGRRLAIRRMAADPSGAREGLTALEGAVFGLMGLLVAFSFSGAATRFDQRRQLVVQEANDIGTAYLRVSLLPEAAQPAMRDYFRRYLDLRMIAYRRASSNLAEALAAHQESTQIQGKMWSLAIEATRDNSSPQTTILFLPALNQMFDTSTTQFMAAKIHPPWIIFIMLVVLALASSLLAGYDMPGGKRRSWIHTVSFAGIMAISVYVILDLEFPRLGLIRIDDVDQALLQVRDGMK